MRRRDFITVLGAVTCSFAADAQQATKLRTIGYLGAGSQAGWSAWTAAFLQRLHELGWIEGRTVAIEYRWAEGRSERFGEISAEFVRTQRRRDSYGWQCGDCRNARNFDDPDCVRDSSGPGRHRHGRFAGATGRQRYWSISANDRAARKRIELLRQLVPNLGRLAVIGNVSYAGAAEEIVEVQAVARKVELDVDVLGIRRAEDIAPAFDTLRSGTQALYVCSDALINASHPRINTLALGARLPTIHGLRDFLGSGGLMSYGAKPSEMFRRAGDYVDKILKGAKPADLPVEQPTKFELVVNLTTAKALGLHIPDAFLLRIDETIE